MSRQVSIRTNHCAALRSPRGDAPGLCSGRTEWEGEWARVCGARVGGTGAWMRRVQQKGTEQRGGAPCPGAIGLLMLAPAARLGVRGGPAKCFARNVARAVVGPSASPMSSLFFFPSFLPPALCWHRRLPLPPHAGIFPRQVLQTPVTFTDIPARNSRTNTSLVQMLLTFSHCFWKGKHSLRFAAQTVAEVP